MEQFFQIFKVLVKFHWVQSFFLARPLEFPLAFHLFIFFLSHSVARSGAFYTLKTKLLSRSKFIYFIFSFKFVSKSFLNNKYTRGEPKSSLKKNCIAFLISLRKDLNTPPGNISISPLMLSPEMCEGLTCFVITKLSVNVSRV